MNEDSPEAIKFAAWNKQFGYLWKDLQMSNFNRISRFFYTSIYNIKVTDELKCRPMLICSVFDKHTKKMVIDDVYIDNFIYNFGYIQVLKETERGNYSDLMTIQKDNFTSKIEASTSVTLNQRMSKSDPTCVDCVPLSTNFQLTPNKFFPQHYMESRNWSDMIYKLKTPPVTLKDFMNKDSFGATNYLRMQNIFEQNMIPTYVLQSNYFDNNYYNGLKKYYELNGPELLLAKNGDEKMRKYWYQFAKLKGVAAHDGMSVNEIRDSVCNK
jgi:hypothetical protein